MTLRFGSLLYGNDFPLVVGASDTVLKELKKELKYLKK